MNRSALQLMAACAALAGPGSAQAERMVVVNGQRLDAAQIAWLEQRNCAPIPNGRYWLDTRTGAWGYAGWPQAQGVFGAACRAARPGHRSLSERGLLYRPGEIISGR